jgi:hypothetical protein
MRRWMSSSDAQRHAWKHLSRGLYWVEMAIVVHDFLFGNEAQASIKPQARTRGRHARPKNRHEG